MSEPTHREVKSPEVTCRELADYNAGSERNRRSVVEGAKYKPIMRLRQHKDAHRVLVKCLGGGKSPKSEFTSEIERLAAKICDNEHELKERDINVGYLRHVLTFYDEIKVPADVINAAHKWAPITSKRTKVKIGPHLVLRGVGRGNVPIVGALTFRYAKGKALNEEEAKYQAALTLGYLRDNPIDDEAEPKDKLCLVLDCHTGQLHQAPSDSVTRYKNMMAACDSIADMWPNIKPPAGAVID